MSWEALTLQSSHSNPCFHFCFNSSSTKSHISWVWQRFIEKRPSNISPALKFKQNISSRLTNWIIPHQYCHECSRICLFAGWEHKDSWAMFQIGENWVLQTREKILFPNVKNVSSTRAVSVHVRLQGDRSVISVPIQQLFWNILRMNRYWLTSFVAGSMDNLISGWPLLKSCREERRQNDRRHTAKYTCSNSMIWGFEGQKALLVNYRTSDWPII